MNAPSAARELFATNLATYVLFDGPGEPDAQVCVRALPGQSRLLERFVERDRMGRLRDAASRLRLTTAQQSDVRTTFDECEPLIAELEHDYEVVGHELQELTLGTQDYEVRLAVLSARRGALTTLLALAAGQLRSRVFAVLTASQQSLLSTLRKTVPGLAYWPFGANCVQPNGQ